MKWPAYLHSLTPLVGIHLKPDQKKVFTYLSKEMDRFLHAYTLQERLLKKFIASWCEINNETYLPALHEIVKLIRHRLISGSAVTVHRLVHLCNALIRNGGTAAHALIGREKFLRTIVYCIENHCRSRHVLWRDTAAFTYQCFRDWKNGLSERQDLFPYYLKYFQKIEKNYHYLENISLGCYELPECERVSVQVAEEYRILDLPPSIPVLKPSEPIVLQRTPSSPKQNFFKPVCNDNNNKTSFVNGVIGGGGGGLGRMSEDEQSLHLNRISDSSYRNTPSPSIPLDKLAIIIEEEKQEQPDAPDDITAEEQYCQSTSTVSENETITTGTRKSAAILYPQIYEAEKSSSDDIPRPKSVGKSSNKSKSIEYEFNTNLDIEVKYYGTQRVVSCRQKPKNLLESNINSQAILQQ